jgi:hypothetical protein
MSVELNKWLSPENIEKLKNSLLTGNWNTISIKSKIKDEEIVNLNRDLKKSRLNVIDLLWDNN